MDEFLANKNLFSLKAIKLLWQNELIEQEPDRHPDLEYSFEVCVGGGLLWEDNSR